jgi:hypothetical protein
MRKEEDEEEKPAEQLTRSDKSARKTPKVVEADDEVADDALLGEATLAKMNAAAETENKKPATDTPEAPVTPATTE